MPVSLCRTPPKKEGRRHQGASPYIYIYYKNIFISASKAVSPGLLFGKAWSYPTDDISSVLRLCIGDISLGWRIAFQLCRSSASTPCNLMDHHGSPWITTCEVRMWSNIKDTIGVPKQSLASGNQFSKWTYVHIGSSCKFGCDTELLLDLAELDAWYTVQAHRCTMQIQAASVAFEASRVLNS